MSFCIFRSYFGQSAGNGTEIPFKVSYWRQFSWERFSAWPKPGRVDAPLAGKSRLAGLYHPMSAGGGPKTR